jgi:hypothetical protein
MTQPPKQRSTGADPLAIPELRSAWWEVGLQASCRCRVNDRLAVASVQDHSLGEDCAVSCGRSAPGVLGAKSARDATGQAIG